jgi:hypothetical protein
MAAATKDYFFVSSRRSGLAWEFHTMLCAAFAVLIAIRSSERRTAVAGIRYYALFREVQLRSSLLSTLGRCRSMFPARLPLLSLTGMSEMLVTALKLSVLVAKKEYKECPHMGIKSMYSPVPRDPYSSVMLAN